MLKLQQHEYNMLFTMSLAILAFWVLLPSNHQLVDAAQPRRALQQSGDWHKVGDTCDKNAHCLNGGICRPADKDEGSNRHCHCKDGFSGSRCEHYCPLSCQNGGYCHHLGHELPTFGDNQDVSVNDFQCKCLGYFTGSLCEIPFENCLDRKQCFYGGKCRQIRRPTESGGAYIGSYCECPAERYGDACEFSNATNATGDDPNTPLDKPQRILSGLVVGAVFFLATLIGSSLMVRRARYKEAWARTRAKEEAMIQDVIYISRHDRNVNWMNTQ
jgi:hypothetical protein